MEKGQSFVNGMRDKVTAGTAARAAAALLTLGIVTAVDTGDVYAQVRTGPTPTVNPVPQGSPTVPPLPTATVATCGECGSPTPVPPTKTPALPTKTPTGVPATDTDTATPVVVRASATPTPNKVPAGSPTVPPLPSATVPTCCEATPTETATAANTATATQTATATGTAVPPLPPTNTPAPTSTQRPTSPSAAPHGGVDIEVVDCTGAIDTDEQEPITLNYGSNTVNDRIVNGVDKRNDLGVANGWTVNFEGMSETFNVTQNGVAYVTFKEATEGNCAAPTATAKTEAAPTATKTATPVKQEQHQKPQKKVTPTQVKGAVSPAPTSGETGGGVYLAGMGNGNEEDSTDGRNTLFGAIAATIALAGLGLKVRTNRGSSFQNTANKSREQKNQ